MTANPVAQTDDPNNEPLTPDFYRYRWAPLTSATIDGRFVVVEWPDGLSLRAFDLWLWENTVGSSIDIATRESVADPADLDDRIAPESVTVTETGSLLVTWHSGRADATYHPGWLRHVAEGRHRPDAHLPEPVPWLAADLGQPPTHDGHTALDDTDDVIDRWVEDLLRYGIARLAGLPLDPDLALTLISRFGAVRDTNFGLIWDVKALVEPDSTANTNYRLCPHTDLPTREIPPGFQFLHCIANTVQGGNSTMADGLAVAHDLAVTHPEQYRDLTTLKWVFFNRSPAADHRWSGPIIDLGVDGSPLTIRAFHPVRGFPDMDEADVPRAYAALKLFSRTAAEPRFQIRYPFRPGDLVGFDNRRILHGRDAYSSRGHRHLRGLYMDHDELYSYARLSARRRLAEGGESASPSA
jgi:gamma-butyrobetaine dioxygenase